MSGNILAHFILTSGPITSAFWPGVDVCNKFFFLYPCSVSDTQTSRSPLVLRERSSGGHFFARRRFVYSDVFICASWKSPRCRVKRRCMNIQHRNKRRTESVSSAVRARLGEAKGIRRLLFHLSYPSHITLWRCLLPFPLFVPMCRLEGRIIGFRMQVQRPLAYGHRISHSQDEGRRQGRREDRVDDKVLRRGDATDGAQE